MDKKFIKGGCNNNPDTLYSVYNLIKRGKK